MAYLKVLVTLAFRNLFTHKITSGIVGSIVFFGVFLLVLGTALLGSIEDSMERSVTSSLAGHLQLYSNNSRDELALFGAGFMGGDDFGEMENFSEIREVVESVPNVKAIVPMGSQLVTVATGNEIDQVLESLRKAVQTGAADRVVPLSGQVKDIAQDMEVEQRNALAIAADTEAVEERIANVQRAQSPEFWAQFEGDPNGSILFLETKIAPLAADGRLVYLRNLGTDLDRFTEHFDRFKIVDGEMVPQGQRGFLFAKRTYERWIKHKVARELDAIKRGRDDKGKTITDDAGMKDKARRLPRQYRRITYQLDPAEAAELEALLRKKFPDEPGDLVALVQQLLTVTDATFEDHYAYFYEHVAPRVRLYYVNVGDDVILRSFTKTGYLKAVSVPVYGTYEFTSLEKSDLAGAHNLLDMMSFRELYGLMNDETRSELAGIKETVGVGDIDKDAAEDALFGGGADIVADVTATSAFDEFSEVDIASVRAEYDHGASDVFTQKQIDEGLAINAAVILEDSLLLEDTQTAVSAALTNAGFDMKVVDWQTASGILGQFITVVYLILFTAICIIFLVALVIINNAMVMATMERVNEIGTMRAIGAQRRFVLLLFLLETLVLAFLAGTAGAIAGAGMVSLLAASGIPASNDVMIFLFSGTHLYPTVSMWNLVFAFLMVLLVSVASTLYPASIATRIQPVVAMEAKE